ncbi:MAG: hypothetical protein ACK4RV_01570 [Caulobacter sp.]|jgi:hypothetical protein
MTVNRRLLFSAPLLAVPLIASPALAARREMDCSRVFVFLDNFLRLSPAERARLKVSFYLTQKGRAPKGVKAWLVDKDGTITQLPIGADGRFQRLPTLKQLVDKSTIVFEGEETSGYSVRIGLVWGERPEEEMSAAELTRILADTNAIVKKAAGVFSVAAPKMVQVAFPGGAGEVVMASGQTQPLPMFRGSPAFNPSTLAGAKLVRFSKLPRHMEFAGPKHSGVVFT